MERKYIIIIGAVIFLVIGTITVILILKKKKGGNGGNGGNGNGGNGNGGSGGEVIDGCPYNSSTLEAPTNNIIQISGNYTFKCFKNNRFPYYMYLSYSNKDYFISYISASSTAPIIYYNSFTQQLEHEYNSNKYYLDVKDPCCSNICGNQSSVFPECVSGNLYWTQTSTSKFILTNDSIYSIDAKAYIVPNQNACKIYTSSGCGAEGNCSDIYSLTFSADENSSNIWDILPST